MLDAVVPISLYFFLRALKTNYGIKQGVRAILWSKPDVDGDAEDLGEDDESEGQRQRPGGRVIWSSSVSGPIDAILLGRSTATTNLLLHFSYNDDEHKTLEQVDSMADFGPLGGRSVAIVGKGWLRVQNISELAITLWRDDGAMLPAWVPEKMVTAGPFLGVSAASFHANASKEVLQLGDTGIIRGVCVIHSERALAKSKSLFVEWSQPKLNAMRADIECMKAFPFPLLETHVIKQMLKKWSKASGLGEKALATAWGTSWAHDDWKMMRTSLNVTGGLPNDNQCLEGKNGSQKQAVEFKRLGLTQFVPEFVKWLTNESCEDCAMGMQMPTGRYGTEVWSISFFQSVSDELDRRVEGTGIFVCAFDRLDEDGQPSGIKDVASRRLITLLVDTYKVRDEKDALRKALSQSKKKDQPSWLESYVQLATCEVAKAGDLGLNFDQLIDYGTAFRTLTPIEDPLYTAQLAERLMRSGMTLNMSCICYSSSIPKGSEVRVSAIDPSRLKKNGFVYCTCDAYTHYHWCIHCCGDAKLRGLIKKWPPTLEPMLVGSRSKGRIPNALPGGALGRR